MNNFDLTKFLAEGKLYEASIPSGWKKIDTSNDYEEEERQGRLMGFEAPMNGIEGDEVDNIYIEQDGDEFEVHIMTAFNNPEYKGPFNSKEEALKVATQKMEDLKKDWDEKDLGEGKLHEAINLTSLLDKYDLDMGWYKKHLIGIDELTPEEEADLEYVESRIKAHLQTQGKLNEAMSPQDVVDIADTVAEEFTKESAEEGDFMIYSVGEMDVDDMTFELDTDTTAQTPERILKMSNLGVGEGWGGSFRISPKEEGYEVRNSEKGGLVAIIDGMGNFRMLSNDESKAEMGMADGEKTDFMQRRKETDDYMEEGKDEVKEIKSNKMKKSELKEMIKAAMSENARTDAEEEGYLDGMRDEKEDMKEAEDVEVEDDENIDVDIEKDVDVKVDDEESEVDVDIKASMPGESEDVEEVQALLMKAQEAAESLGDDKLQDQIGNTITYFTRAHVAGNVSEADLDMDLSVGDRAEEAEIGLDEAKENLNESVTFPMWNKIK